MPSECYPVIHESWMPRYGLNERLASADIVGGYLYDWHEAPDDNCGCWYVGVVRAALAKTLEAAAEAGTLSISPGF